MPIEFAPPQPQLQGFNVPPPQSGDPLQTLAQIQNFRTQNLQRQGAQQELQTGEIKLQQAQEDLADQQKLRKVYSDWTAAGNPNLDDLVKQASAAGIGPRILMPLQQQVLEHRSKLATTKEAELKNLVSTQAQQTQAFNAVASAPPDQRPAAWQTERGKLITSGFAKSDEIAADYPGDVAFEELRHHNRTSQQELDLVKEQREAEAAKLQATKTGQEITAGARAQLVADIRSADQDPKTGTPTPSAWQAILTNPTYKGLNLPGQPTKAYIDRMAESTVPQKDIPEYNINQMKAKLGILGNTEFDQALAQHARSLNKTPAQLTPDEFFAGVEKFRQYNQDPLMREILLGTKTAQEAIAKVQAGSLLNQKQIQDTAQDLVDGKMTLDQIKTLRASRTNQSGQIIDAARDIAKAKGAPLDLFDLEQQADFREKTLQEFASTQVSHAGGQKMALDTMIHHADLWMDVAKALKNGTFKPGNELYNKVASMFGAAPPTDAALVAQFFASETGKVATGGVPAEGEIKGILKNLSTSGSPEAMESAGRTLLGIAAGRMVPLKELAAKARLEKYVDVPGKEAREILQRRGFNPETMKPVAAGALKPPAGAPAGAIPVPLKSGSTAWLTPAKAAEFRRDHPDLVK